MSNIKNEAVSYTGFIKEQLLHKNNILMLLSYIVTYFIGKMQEKGGILYVTV